MKRYIKSAIGNIFEEDYLTRFEIAKSSTDPIILRKLASDDVELVRLGVYNNPNAPQEVKSVAMYHGVSTSSVSYQIYCYGDIADKEEISDIVDKAIMDGAFLDGSPQITGTQDVLSVSGKFIVPHRSQCEYDTLDHIHDALDHSGHHVTNAFIVSVWQVPIR